MNSILQEAIGAGLGGLVTLLIVSIVQNRGKIGRLPKRVDRLDVVVPPLLRAVIALLQCQKEGKCNASVDESIDELNRLMTDGIVSRKAGK